MNASSAKLRQSNESSRSSQVISKFHLTTLVPQEDLARMAAAETLSEAKPVNQGCACFFRDPQFYQMR